MDVPIYITLVPQTITLVPQTKKQGKKSLSRNWFSRSFYIYIFFLFFSGESVKYVFFC